MQRYRDILCVVEPGELCSQALERAVTLAENNQASLTMAAVAPHVTAGIGMPDGGPISADLQAAVVSAHTQGLENLVDPYRSRMEIETKVLTGTPFLEIIHEVQRHGHDLVIKVPEISDWLDRLFGSDDMHLLRKCPCPVWLIKPGKPKAYRCILAAVDVDDTYPPGELDTRHALNRQILEMACSLALSEFAELHIVHAWEVMPESALREMFLHTPEEKIIVYADQARRRHTINLDTLIHEVAGNLGKDTLDYLKPHTHLVKGWARREIPGLVKQIDADLVVMGTVARTGIPGFIMGNTAETILNQIDCSVLAIKPPGFVTPVV
jgi:nucleotide-binding universal stress UspA family protein